jgi:hypothetical protein
MEHGGEVQDGSKSQEGKKAQTNDETHAAEIELVQGPGEATVWSVIGYWMLRRIGDVCWTHWMKM